MVLEVQTSNNSNLTGKDKYEESVDFQNNCRSFYLSRVKATESFKQKLGCDNGNQKKNSMSAAMDKLRSEMASLVDQDLSLMKQLLTLNETIEEIKSRRLYGVSKEPLDDSTYSLTTSTGQLSKSMSTMSLSSQQSSDINMSEDDLSQQATDKCNNDPDSDDSGYGE